MVSIYVLFLNFHSFSSLTSFSSENTITEKKAVAKRAMKSSLVQASASVSFTTKLLKLTLPVPLSYYDLVTFYNCFTIFRRTYTPNIFQAQVSVMLHR